MTKVSKWDNLARWIRGSSSVRVNEDGDGGVTIANTRYIGVYSGLPSNPYVGQVACITDAFKPVYRSISAGGGLEVAEVLWDGTDWIYT